jgi:putative glutamine amidotransferase
VASDCAIGICTAIEQVQRGPWNEVAAMVQRSYADAVQREGALALLLPPDDDAASAPDPLLDRIDGLLLAGGSDVDPSFYGARRHPATERTWPERDRFELGLVRRALERGIPVLGICRGMQLLNVALGGTLVQHLPDLLGVDDHRVTLGVFGEHEVRLEPGSLAARAAGGERIVVKSHHHQGIDELGEGLIATGWGVGSELVEAVELPERRYALGVLWHPEEDGRSRVIASVVDASRAAVGAR